MSLLLLPVLAAAAGVLTYWIRKIALARGRLDVPNARSSHRVPTPRGGGASIVLIMSTMVIVLAIAGQIDRGLWLALLGGGIAIAMVGHADDRFGLSPGLRLGVHALAAAWTLWCLGGLAPLQIGSQVKSLHFGGDLLAGVGIVWIINLFNFMDGIDGIAASEAIFIASAGVLLGQFTPFPRQDVYALGLLLSAACSGFLVWNWPPARIFLGDVGSGYLGFVLAVLALASTGRDPGAPWIWLILGGVFFVDATVTLLRRAVRGEPLHAAHRSHAYQWLARRWGSHRRVTIWVALINVGWLLPCSILATHFPSSSLMVLLVAYIPIGLIAIRAGAGTPESLE